MVAFKSQWDASFAEGLRMADAAYNIVMGQPFTEALAAAESHFPDCFTLCPLFTKPNEALNAVGWRVKGKGTIASFYVKHAAELGSQVRVIIDNPTSSVQPELLFELSTSTDIAQAYWFGGCRDHVCFSPALDFVVANDTNSMLVGYGKAGDWVRQFHKDHPNMFVGG